MEKYNNKKYLKYQSMEEEPRLRKKKLDKNEVVVFQKKSIQKDKLDKNEVIVFQKKSIQKDVFS